MALVMYATNSLLLHSAPLGNSALAATLTAAPAPPISPARASWSRSVAPAVPCQTATVRLFPAASAGVPLTDSCINSARGEKLRPWSRVSAKYRPGAPASPAAYQTTLSAPFMSVDNDGPETGQPCNIHLSSLTITGAEKLAAPSVELATAMWRKLPGSTWRQLA